MCYTDADEELWQEDPYEYIRMKFGEHLKSTHVKKWFHAKMGFLWGVFMKTEMALIFKKKKKNSVLIK